MNKYTSLELSKKLKDCGLESDNWWQSDFQQFDNGESSEEFTIIKKEDYVKKSWCSEFTLLFPAYDILNDICVKYAKEFFGDHEVCYECGHTACMCDCTYREVAFERHTFHILHLLQQGKKQEAEDYIWEHCLFNPKNQSNPELL